jgi:hypothetical protein
VPGEAHADVIGCADALIAYYAENDPGARRAMMNALAGLPLQAVPPPLRKGSS